MMFGGGSAAQQLVAAWDHRRVVVELKKKDNQKTTVNNGYLGSCNDEERSKLRYVMWIAEYSESSNLWTQMALTAT